MSSPYNVKLVGFNLSDRNGKERFSVNSIEGSTTEVVLSDINQQEFFKVKDYGDTSGCYLQMGKPNTKFIIGGFSSDAIIGDRKFVVKGNALTQGKVAIGGSDVVPFGNFPTTSGAVNNVANYNLFVKGGILTEEVRVSLATTWADYVFSKDYKMPTLPELEKKIQEKGHLPNMPSAQEVKENGIELGEMAKMQQEKIEELTLYIIQINKELQELKAKIKN